MAEYDSSFGEYPHWAIPTIFADGVLNLLPSGEVVRFYLGRSDPAVGTDKPLQTRAVAQVVLSRSAFLHTAIFFERALKELVAAGTASEAEIETIRSSYEGATDAADA